MNISILGGGSWGTALAVHLARKDHSIKIWEFFKEQADQMQKERICPLLPETKLAKNIMISSQMSEVLADYGLLIIAVPSDKVELTLEKAKEFIGTQPVIIASKGFGSDLKLLSEVVREKVKGDVYCLYGPTHAEEVCKEIFSGIVLAGGDGKKLKEIIASENLKVELSDDLVGVQVCAALKNILAVMIGIVRGAGLGDNTAAYILTKGLDEIKQVGMKWGAKEETFYGLAGLGDIFVTCTSQHSRNFTLGEKVGGGRKLDSVLKEMKMVAEGVTTAKEIPQLKKKFGLELPLMTGVYEILFDGKTVKDVLKKL